MRRWSDLAERVGATTRTSEKTALLADYLRSLTPDEVPVAALLVEPRRDEQRELVERQRPTGSTAGRERDSRARVPGEVVQREAQRSDVRGAAEAHRARQHAAGPRAECQQQRVIGELAAGVGDHAAGAGFTDAIAACT